MSDRSAASEELIKIISEVVGIEKNRLRPENKLVRDLGLDSFSLIELLVFVEKRYKIKILEEDLLEDRTVADWFLLIEQRIASVKN